MLVTSVKGKIEIVVDGDYEDCGTVYNFFFLDKSVKVKIPKAYSSLSAAAATVEFFYHSYFRFNKHLVFSIHIQYLV